MAFQIEAAVLEAVEDERVVAALEVADLEAGPLRVRTTRATMMRWNTMPDTIPQAQEAVVAVEQVEPEQVEPAAQKAAHPPRANG